MGGQTITDARFCSRCAMRPAGEDRARVCGACGMGVVLSARGGPPSDPFLIVSGARRVVSVSIQAEALVGAEEELLGRPLAAVLAQSGPFETTLAECGPPPAVLVTLKPALRVVQEPLQR